MQPDKQQIKSFDKNKDIPLEGTRKYLSEVYIVLAFKYYPLTWVFCSKNSNNQINKIHKRTLRLVYEMEDANFEDLLLKGNSWNVHESNIHTLFID